MFCVYWAVITYLYIIKAPLIIHSLFVVHILHSNSQLLMEQIYGRPTDVLVWIPLWDRFVLLISKFSGQYKYCRSGNIREVFIFANYGRRKNSRIQEYRENNYYNRVTEEK